MQIPTWEQFSAVFADSGDEQTHAVREVLIQQYGECDEDSATSSLDNYMDALIAVYGYFLDYKEGTFSVIEWLEEKLGNAFTAEFDDDYDTVKTRFGDKEMVLTHHGMDADEFEQDLAQLERLMEGRYYFIYQCISGGVGDTMELLLVPSEYWCKAQKIYGQDCVEAHFKRYVSEAPHARQGVAQGTAIGDDPLVGTGQIPDASQRSNKESGRGAFYLRLFLLVGLPVIVVLYLYMA